MSDRPLIYFPADIAEMLGVGRKRAIAIMREAGGFMASSLKNSWRLDAEKFEEWRRNAATSTGSTSEGDTGGSHGTRSTGKRDQPGAQPSKRPKQSLQTGSDAPLIRPTHARGRKS